MTNKNLFYVIFFNMDKLIETIIVFIWNVAGSPEFIPIFSLMKFITDDT
jgi:hypothetical protein